MGVETKPDFSGYATKAGLKCSDGRTILPGAFKHQDTETVPLVWQHNHDTPENVLGYAVLEHRDDGVYTYAYLNETPQGKNAKMLVEHGDVKSLSIYANQLTEKAKQVLHGMIREVSLVLSGANPGALIDNIALAHSDGDVVTLDDEAIIYTGLVIHSDESEDDPEDKPDESEDDPEDKPDESEDDPEDDPEDKPNDSEDDPEDKPDEASHGDSSTQEIYDSMSAEQKDVVHTMVGAALDNKDDVSHNDDNDDKKEGRRMSRNVFEKSEGKKDAEDKHVLTHDAMRGIVDTAKKLGSLRDAVDSYALQHGIENIEVLFPEARNITDTPEFNSRRVEWVTNVLNGTRHSPFSRVKSLVADLTFAEARAKGYVKGALKKEEWFSVSKRVTTPSTVYKKQRLDRDDILDITDFDVVLWLKAEMRLMFDEELARAILIGDGRDVDDDDKIRDPAGTPEGAGIRSILYDHDLYAPTFTVDDSAAGTDVVDGITSAMGSYKGSGGATLYTTLPVLTNILLTRDEFGHRLWKSAADLATEIGVSDIVTVEVMEDESDLLGIIVNLRDYTIGADKGGEVNFFDFFDIDYNQYKYLYESRLSGALTKIRSAIVIKRAESGGTLVVPVEPDFDGTIVTVATTAHVTYKDASDDSTLTTGAPVTLDEGEELTVYAVAASGYYFADNIHDQWTFKNTTSA
jgi:HK97 family phage prohead protease